MASNKKINANANSIDEVEVEVENSFIYPGTLFSLGHVLQMVQLMLLNKHT